MKIYMGNNNVAVLTASIFICVFLYCKCMELKSVNTQMGLKLEQLLNLKKRKSVTTLATKYNIDWKPDKK